MVKRRRRSKKWISRLIILVLLVVAGVVVYYVWNTYFNNEQVKTTETEIINTNQQNNTESLSEETIQEEKEKAVQFDGDSPNTTEELTGALTYAEVQDGRLSVRINIDQYLDDGECELILEKEGVKIYSDKTKIIENVTTSTCEGFDVDASQFNKGRVNIVINLKANGKNGTIRGEVDF